MSTTASHRRSAREIDRLIMDAARPHGVVTRAILLTVGISLGSIQNRLDAGFLRVIHPGVYAIGSGRLAHDATLMAALLAGGPTSALSHLTAASLWKISRFPAPAIDLLVPHRHESLDGVHVRQTRFLPDAHVAAHFELRRTTVSRTVMDLAEVLNPWQLTNVMKEARRLNRLRVDTIDNFAARYVGRQGNRKLRRALAMHLAGSAGTKSDLEDLLLAIILEAGFPEPEVNRSYRFGAQGFELDFAWPDRRINVEADGHWGHAEPSRAELDRIRDELLPVHGWKFLRLDSELIRSRPDLVVAKLRDIWHAPVGA